jgi:hypothetical protein
VKAKLHTPRAPALDILADVTFCVPTIWLSKKIPFPSHFTRKWPAQIFNSADGEEVSCSLFIYDRITQAEILVRRPGCGFFPRRYQCI